MMPQAAVTLLGQRPIALEGLRHVLTADGFNVVQVSSDPTQLRAAPDTDPSGEVPHLVVIDDLVAVRGPAVVTEVLQTLPDCRPVVLADQFEFGIMKACFEAKACGFVVKKISSKSLVTYLELVAQGERAVPSDLIDELPEAALSSVGAAAINQTLASAGLSLREIQILSCLVSGKPNKVISRQLNISEATVKVHVKAILRKIGVQNRTQAAIWAMEGKVAGIGAGGGGDSPVRAHQGNGSVCSISG